MSDFPEPATLKIPEVAAELRVHPETVRRWLSLGRIRGVKMGSTKGGWRISRSEVDRVLRLGMDTDADQTRS